MGAPALSRGRPAVSLYRRRQRPGVYFVLPAAVMLATFFAYPLFASLLQSFFSTRGGQSQWVGVDQYVRLFHDPLVTQSLLNAGLILIVQVPLMLGLALGLAAVLNTAWIRFRAGYRLTIFLPAVTTLVAYSAVFRVLLATNGGAVNQVLDLVGMAPVDWLNDPTWARISVIASVTWRWTGYNMVILLAGLQAIPSEQYEAARIDGANAWQTFARVVLPQLRPAVVFVTVTSTIGALQLFDENYILTRGGPASATLTPVLYLYKVGFQQFDFGYASAIAWLLVALTALISIIQLRVMRQR